MSAAPAVRATVREPDGWPPYWRSLAYFALSRLVVAAVLIAYVPVLRGTGSLDEGFDAALFVPVAAAYLAAAVVFVGLSRPGRMRLGPLATAQVLADVLALSVLIHAAGGPHGGLAVLLILPNAGAAIILGARIGLSFAAGSTLLLLAETGWRWLRGDAGDLAFLQAGLVGGALLVTAAIVGRLAGRLAAQEELAWRRGEDLRNQLAVTQAVIGELPEGVVVLGPDGRPRALNRSAREMLGGDDAPGGDAGVRSDRVGGGPGVDPPGLATLRAALGGDVVPSAAVEFTLPASGGTPERRARARRLGARAAGGDVVVVVEDLSLVEARAQQLKLASMGRLSASIAHEIRNPLSAIRHANGLLAEQLGEARLQRLATIVEDNCRRIDRVIEDVLSIARRGSATPEALAPEPFLVGVVAEHVAQTGADARRVVCRVETDAPIWFDAGNLRQVLLNLLGNALRHASAARGAVAIEWRAEPDARLVLVVSDDGPGVPEASRVHLFEPFFTTETRGTGLGLHLARELCTANGATIRYRPPSDNPPLRSAFVVEPASAATAER